MPRDDEELHGRFCRLEDQHKQIENRMKGIDDRHQRFEEAVIDIAKSLGKFEAIADDLITLKPKIDKIDVIESKLIAMETKAKTKKEMLFQVGFWAITTILAYILWKNGVSIATINNR